MALNGNNGGDLVAAAIASNPAGIAPGTPVTNAQLKATWEAAITALYGDIHSTAVVNTTDNVTMTAGVVTSGAGAGGTVTGPSVGSGIGTVT